MLYNYIILIKYNVKNTGVLKYKVKNLKNQENINFKN